MTALQCFEVNMQFAGCKMEMKDLCLSWISLIRLWGTSTVPTYSGISITVSYPSPAWCFSQQLYRLRSMPGLRKLPRDHPQPHACVRQTESPCPRSRTKKRQDGTDFQESRLQGEQAKQPKQTRGKKRWQGEGERNAEREEEVAERNGKRREGTTEGGSEKTEGSPEKVLQITGNIGPQGLHVVYATQVNRTNRPSSTQFDIVFFVGLLNLEEEAESGHHFLDSHSALQAWGRNRIRPPEEASPRLKSPGTQSYICGRRKHSRRNANQARRKGTFVQTAQADTPESCIRRHLLWSAFVPMANCNSVKVEANSISVASFVFIVHNFGCDKCPELPYQ